ncbi:imm11 family protein [Ralstonia nicotianae]
MTTQFFDIGFDYNDSTRWYLGQPATPEGEVLPGAFRKGLLWMDPRPMTVQVLQCGVPASFNHSGHAEYIVAVELMDRLREMVPPSVIQGIPITVHGYPAKFEVLNSLDIVDCVDEEHSEFSRWTAEDGQPNKIGNYRMSLLRIDPERAKGHDLFRVKGWTIALICSERVKQCLEDADVTGIRFTPVVHEQ